MYKLPKPFAVNFPITTVYHINDKLWIPFDQANTDYQNFKKQINADEAQLEDADGNLMSAEQAKEFVKELP